MEFNYDGFSKQKWIEMYTDLKEKNWIELDGWYYGCIRVGDLCFDSRIVAAYDRDDCKECFVDFDLYVGGIDSGYGYGKDNYPYEFIDDGVVFEINQFFDLVTYEEFCKEFEKKATEIINWNEKYYGTLIKANEPLHVW